MKKSEAALLLLMVVIIVLAAIYVFKPSLFSGTTTTTKTPTKTTTKTPTKKTTTTTEFPYTSVPSVANTTETTSSEETTITPTTTIATTARYTTTPIPIYTTTNLKIWLDATYSSNWTGDTWVNNSRKSGNAVYNKGVWTIDSWTSSAINNFPGIYFNGFNALAVADPQNTYLNGATVFVVFQPTGADTYRTLVSRTVGAYAAGFGMHSHARYIGSGSAHTYFYSSVNLNDLTPNTPYIFAYRVSVSGTTAKITEWLNGDMQYNNLTLTGYSDTSTELCIGTRSDKQTSFTGYMGEVLVYTGGLTDDEIYGTNTYLSKKWMIPIKPPTYSNYISAEWVTISRADNLTEYVNINEIQIFDSTGAQLIPVSGRTDTGSVAYANYPITNAYDGNPTTTAHTNTASGESYLQVQLASTENTNFNIGKVVIVNRPSLESRLVGCVLRLIKGASPNYYAVYTSPKITKALSVYEMTFDVQNELIVSYSSALGVEVATVYVDGSVLVNQTVSKTPTIMTQTYKIGYTPTLISLKYSNSVNDSGTLYLNKLEYNGKDLKASYVNSNASVQSTVRAGTIAWESTYPFIV